ncbi:MAG TPA: class I SAM-dependent methyltransferase [Polyangiaceae bacterium]|nr:class I SAM-dependent methyltransferase [Polyangiaceae bacterium]
MSDSTPGSDSATRRFSSRVEDYVKYRPSYPRALFDALERECGLERPSVVADVGSGTGIAAALLLERGHRVYGVEPNGAMREAAERLLAGERNFVSVDGRAEATTLADDCVELVFAAQAFHWFDRAACRREFSRILRPGRSVALVWNDRSCDATPFLAAYEELLRTLSVDYEQVNNRDVVSDATLAEFFAPDGFRALGFENFQDFDCDGLFGRARSSSYVPASGHPAHERFFSELARIYELYAVDGIVRFEYTARLIWGRLERTV